ncbi:MAG TPA: methylmalonyl-CoA mutase family protein, partial [Myxococcota bacterium]|nr:methylmalonyl-CoA mutase family protein [Myxococcota bacterium]
MNLKHHVRFVTAASLFDGHDAAIHIMRRILQAEGAEVIHLGHNRSALDVVKAAVEEDAQGIAVSSYQGGHMEYFTYMLELLKQFGASDIEIFGGGGGVIVPEEIKELEKRGIKKIFSPDDGVNMGLIGMIQHMLACADKINSQPIFELSSNTPSVLQIAHTISTLELGADSKEEAFRPARESLLSKIASRLKTGHAPIIGITGTGGAGKSSLIDELILRFLNAFPKKRIAVLSIDPTRMKTGGALLGDRIRMNSASDPRVYVRSMATRGANVSISSTAREVAQFLSLSGFDAVIVETAGIGQSESGIKEIADASIYVMTPEYGAQSQLEKVGMLDVADLVAINKFDKPQSLDALRDVRKAYQRNHQVFDQPLTNMPVLGTSAHIFGDRGTNKFFNRFIDLIKKVSDRPEQWQYEALLEGEPDQHPLIPKKRVHYLSEIADTVRTHHAFIEEQAQIYERIDNLEGALKEISEGYGVAELKEKLSEKKAQVDPALHQDINAFFTHQKHYLAQSQEYEVRGQTITVEDSHQSLSHLTIPRVSVPNFMRKSESVRFVGLENLPGFFPFTAGVFPFKRQGEDPTRMFAGEGSPERTNKRFHYLSLNQPATRLSTAFDSVTLYGENPAVRPDIFGKIGNAGVSVCSLDDAKRLYSGFDLLNPKTSVSMTINGPAPTMLAFFFNAAIDFEV